MSDVTILAGSNYVSPALSVVVMTVYDTVHLSRCLNSLKRQVGAPEMEIIAVYHEGVDNIQALEKDFPGVQFCGASGLQTQAKMITLGITHASGEIVALTVDHCTAEPHWCKKIMELHNGPHTAVGGGLEMGGQSHTAVNWAVHLYDYCSYGYYQHPVKEGPARELSDCNVAYKRMVLEEIADLWANDFHVPLINRALLARGESLWFSPDLLVYQHRSISFARAAGIAYRRGRAFASARMAKCTPVQRIVYMILTPLLPLKLLGKLLGNLVPKGSHLGAMTRAFPFISLFATLWSCGEFVGFVSRRLDTVITVSEE
jgi:hypothetical protein